MVNSLNTSIIDPHPDNSIHVVRSQGRLHIAKGAHYAGSIRNYDNHLLAKIFAIFCRRWIMTIYIEQQAFSVNINSYKQFLENHGLDLSKRLVKQSPHLEQMPLTWDLTTPPMREMLCQSKRDQLWKSLVNSLVANRLNRAIKLIYQGADLEKRFWFRVGFPLSLSNIDENLPKRNFDFFATHFTPLSYALDHQLERIREHLLLVGAQTDYAVEKYVFSRKIRYGLQHIHVPYQNLSSFTDPYDEHFTNQKITFTVRQVNDYKTHSGFFYVTPDAQLINLENL